MGDISQLTRHVTRKLRKTLGPDASVVLFGSAARGQVTWRSDVDLMVITRRPAGPTEPFPPFHFVWETRDSFVAKMRAADDIALACLSYGVELSDDSGWWRSVRESFRLTDWPAWRPKAERALERLRFADAARQDGDLEAMEEELLMAASDLGRSVLLKSRVLPSSRAELPQQLQKAGAHETAATLEALIQGELGEMELEQARSRIERAASALLQVSA